MAYFTIRQVKRANKDGGFHFFEPATIRSFNSRFGRRVYGGRYFVTSERFDYSFPRLYTIRVANEDGSVGTVGKFQQYKSGASARRAILKLIRGER